MHCQWHNKCHISQSPTHLSLAIISSYIGARHAILHLMIHISTCIYQLFNYVHMALVTSHMNSSPAIVLLDVFISTIAHKNFHRLENEIESPLSINVGFVGLIWNDFIAPELHKNTKDSLQIKEINLLHDIKKLKLKQKVHLIPQWTTVE